MNGLSAASIALIAGLGTLGGCANLAPVVSFRADTLRLPAGVHRLIAVDVVDPEGEPVTITVSADRGFAIIEGTDIRYTAPAQEGEDNVRVQAHDGTHTSMATLVITVDDPMDWSAPQQIADTAGNSKAPAVVLTDDGTVHVAWHDFTEDPPALHYAALVGTDWQTGLLDLGPDKLIRPQLVADGARVHLVYDRFIDGDYDILHTVLSDGAWSPPTLVGEGRKASPALLDGVLHVVRYGEGNAPAHAWHADTGWIDEGLLPFTSPYINPIRLKLVATQTGLELAILLSPGETSYDMNVVRWTVDDGWEDPEIIYVSAFLGAEEPAGTTDVSGDARWAWAEQDPVDVWTYDIVSMPTSPGEEPVRGTTLEGFNSSPALAVPSEQGLVLIWLSEGGVLYVARQPFEDEPLRLSDAARGPQITTDDDGYLHLVWVGVVDGIEQIFYASTRP
jgi:hypothetical protein